MSKFKLGVRVVVIDGDTHEIRKGVIDNVYETLEVAIVKFDDGNVEKVGFDYLSIESEKKSEITITEEEFIDIVTDIATEFATKHGYTVGLKTTLLGAEIGKRLFRKPVKND